MVERNGRHEGTRTPDLYRVKMALFGNFNIRARKIGGELAGKLTGYARSACIEHSARFFHENGRLTALLGVRTRAGRSPATPNAPSKAIPAGPNVPFSKIGQ